MRWLRGYVHLLPSLAAWVWYLGLAWWKERLASFKLSSDCHMRAVVNTCPHKMDRQTDRQMWETTNQSTWSPPLTEQEPKQNILINVGKTPDRIYIFHDKNSQATGTSSAWGSLDVRNTELTLNSWWRADSCPARTGEGCLLLLISFATVMEGLARAIRRKLKAVWPGNEELRL